jgi:hypothetical protein
VLDHRAFGGAVDGASLVREVWKSMYIVEAKHSISRTQLAELGRTRSGSPERKHAKTASCERGGGTSIEGGKGEKPLKKRNRDLLSSKYQKTPRTPLPPVYERERGKRPLQISSPRPIVKTLNPIALSLSASRIPRPSKTKLSRPHHIVRGQRSSGEAR